MDVELRHEILPMFFDRFDADAEFRGGLFVGLALGNKLEHLQLARTQAGNLLPLGSPFRGRLLIVQSLGNGGAEKSVSLLNFPNRHGQILGGDLFEQKTHRADPDRLVDVRVIAVRGENDYLGIRKGLADLPRGFQSIE